MTNNMGRIVSRQELTTIVADVKKQGKRIVTTNGAFDILHVGHVRSLQQARSFGDVLIVGVNADSSVKKYKSDKRPVIPEQDRAEMLASLACVDYVTIFEETDPCALLEVIQPHVHVKSGDYDPEKMIETPVVRKYGGEVRITRFIPGISTTAIIKRISEVYGQNPA
jgi:glycerol-3-phosphate cytidylyltransferase